MCTFCSVQIGGAAYFTADIMFMIVVMSIYGDIFGKLITEKVNKFRIVGNCLRGAGATNMLVYT